jgi:hypothetical protein
MGSLGKDIGSALGYAASGAERGRESRDTGAELTNWQGLDTNVGPNAYANIQQNPQYMAAAGQALSQLGGLASGTGMTPQESSALQAAQLSNAQQQGSAAQGALNRASASGTLNSGRALSGLLGANQTATNANAQAGAQAAANSAAQRQAAMGQAGQLGNQLSNTQFGQQATIAQGTNAYNQQGLQNRVGKVQGENSAYDKLVALNQNQAQGIQNMAGSLGDAAGQIGQAVATGGASLGMNAASSMIPGPQGVADVTPSAPMH